MLSKLCPVNLALNALSFGLMLLDEAIGAVYGTPAEVVDAVGPWASVDEIPL